MYLRLSKTGSAVCDWLYRCSLPREAFHKLTREEVARAVAFLHVAHVFAPFLSYSHTWSIKQEKNNCMTMSKLAIKEAGSVYTQNGVCNLKPPLMALESTEVTAITDEPGQQTDTCTFRVISCHTANGCKFTVAAT